MKLLVACIFGISLLFGSTSAQTCSAVQIATWVANNLTPTCGQLLLTFNTSSTSPQGIAALDTTCTDDACGGAVYRYLLNNCQGEPILAFGQQQRCATNGRVRCYYAEFPTPYPTFFNSTAFTDAGSTCALASAANPCPDGCAEALMTLSDQMGCCFNNYYNMTGMPVGFASYQLWAACGVPTLARCPEILSPNAPTMMTTAGSEAIAASMVALLILSAMNIFFVL